MDARGPRRVETRVVAAFAAAAAVAAALGWASIHVNLERACALRESVAASVCAAAPPVGSAEQSELMRARIARNPGDARAWTALALGDRSAAKPRLLEAAATLAPREPNLLLQRAAVAFDRRDFPAAIPLLVELLDGWDGVRLAAAGLAHIVDTGRGALLEPYLVPGSHWLQRFLADMPRDRRGISGALPLIAKAVQRGVIDEDAARGYVGELRAAGAWADAYALWILLHGKSAPALYNASFDQPFEPDGFDWELTNGGRRGGVSVERSRADLRGIVLALQFNGRAVELPIVRQFLFIGPGRYRVRGEFAARQFRSTEGLAWRMRCGNNAIGQSAPLLDTQGSWTPFQLEFDVPRDCGLVAALQLEATSPAEAAAGMRGRVLFDALSLERISP